MKTIGLIGGMSWESTVTYYQIINEQVKKRLGGLHSAKCLLYSVDFEEIERCQSEGDWVKAGAILAEAALSLEKGGADFIVICTNTMHKVIADIKEKITIPVLHIADATADQIKKKGIRKVGLLGTKYTMEEDFYTSRLLQSGLQIVLPGPSERMLINKVIFEELCLGSLRSSSRDYFKRVMKNMIAEGAEGIILGCTEIGLLIREEDSELPLFDTTIIHAVEAVNQALIEE